MAGTTGGSVTLTFPGLPGSPSGVVYVWYLNGIAFTTTTSGVYTITNAITAQSGTYAVYAYAPGGVTGSASWNVTITNPPIIIVPSVSTLAVNDGSSGSFTVSLATAPIANVTRERRHQRHARAHRHPVIHHHDADQLPEPDRRGQRRGDQFQ